MSDGCRQDGVYVMIGHVVTGIATIVVSSAVLLAGAAGVHASRRGRGSLRTWTGVVALSGAGIGAGALMVQSDPDLVSWVITLPASALVGTVNVRSLFAGDGPLHT
jgi:hypothetical protein